MFFLSERLAGSLISPEGANKTPAHGNCGPATISPVTCNAPLELLAPGSTTFIVAVDLPPFIASEFAIHDPNLAATFPSSKVLTTPDSDPAGGGGSQGFPLAPRAPPTVSSTFCVWSELGPTISSNTPGSTTRCMSTFQSESISGVTVKSTVFFSPGFKVIRLKPASCITGLVTEATF